MYRQCRKREIDRERKWRKSKRKGRFRNVIHVCDFEKAEAAEDSPSWLSDNGKGADDIYAAVDGENTLAAEQAREEAEKADLIIHVADASAPDTPEQIKAVENVLREIGAFEKPTILALNKSDKLSFARGHELRTMYPEALFISALEKTGFEKLLDRINEKRKSPKPWAKLKFPPDRGDLVAKLFARCTVRNLSYEEDAIRLEAEIPKDLRAEYYPYREKSQEEES